MLVTPFDAAGNILLSDIESLVSHVQDAGCAGVSCLGIGGEAGYLSLAERYAVAEAVLAIAEVPTIVGCTAATADDSANLARHAVENGAACVMVAPPPTPGLTAKALLAHIEEVAAAAAPAWLMVQDAPQFLGVSVDPGLVRQLRERCANIRYAKPEGLPAADRIADFITNAGVAVFGGNGGLYVLDVLEAGGSGLIPGCELARTNQLIFEAYRGGRLDEARSLYARGLPLLVAEFQSLDHFLGAQKTVLVELGVISSPRTRAPGTTSSLARRLLLAHARSAGVFD
jgi:2-keto-3-deoxy-L-arabinonate dehydratase